MLINDDGTHEDMLVVTMVMLTVTNDNSDNFSFIYRECMGFEAESVSKI